MIYSDRFAEAMATTILLGYGESPISMNDDDLKRYLDEIIEDGLNLSIALKESDSKLGNLIEYENIQKDGTVSFYEKRKAPYMCGIFMILYLMCNYLKRDCSDFYKLDSLSVMAMYSSMVNGFISSLIMDYDFDSYGRLDYKANYLPSPMITEYIGTIYKTELYMHVFQNNINEYKPIYENRIAMLYWKNDKRIISTGISFMQIQAILLLMGCSNVYPLYIQKIAKSIITIFKELLANARIQKIEIDPAICAGSIRKGVKKTTGIKFFLR